MEQSVEPEHEPIVDAVDAVGGSLGFGRHSTSEADWAACDWTYWT